MDDVLIERFRARLDVRGPDDCWEWQGTRLPTGYGLLTRPRTTQKPYVHRIAWELAHGPIPEGMFVCHHCDNPPCCNPAHLFIGTSRTNIADMDAKGRRRSAAKVTLAQAEEIRAAYLSDRQLTLKVLGARYGISVSAVCRIIRGDRRKGAGIPRTAPGKPTRHPSTRTHCRRGHPMTPENVKPTNNGRTCRVCIHDSARRRREAIRLSVPA